MIEDGIALITEFLYQSDPRRIIPIRGHVLQIVEESHAGLFPLKVVGSFAQRRQNLDLLLFGQFAKRLAI